MEEQKIEVVEQKVQENVAPKSEHPHGDRRPHRDGAHRPDRKGDRRGPRRDMRQEKEFEERVVTINRISKTVKGGRRLRFAAVVVVGDGKGRFGFGTGKAGEVPDAIKKATEAARKEIFKLHMVKGDTIAHEITGVFGACRVFLKPAPEGTGIVAGGPVRAVLELAGIKNIYSKVYGSRTPINIIRATADGLNNVKTYNQVVALRK